MTERRFYTVRWIAWSWSGSHWADCGHRHRALNGAKKCAGGLFAPRRADVFVVTERRRVAWDPTYSRMEEEP